jgi:hypothetical protein
MRVTICRFNEDKNEFIFQVESESQEESSMLMELGNRAKAPVSTHGMVGKSATWLWLHIPLKTNTGMFTSFGNQK